MSLEMFREFLGWSALLNIALVLWWFSWIVFFHDFLYRIHSRWFKFSSVESFDTIHYVGIAFYEIVVWAFFIIPWIALHIIS